MIGGLFILMVMVGVCIAGYCLGGMGGLVIAIVICLLLLGGSKNDDSELMKLIEAMDNGDENARQKLAEKNLSEKKFCELREKIYLPKAQAGDREAQRWMGLICLYGKNDAKQAKMWYEKAAAQGDVEAMTSLALGYSEVRNDPQHDMGIKGFGYDPQKEMYWYEKAAKLGDGSSQCSLAMEYKLRKDMDQAYYWYTQATYSRDCAARMDAYYGLADIHGYMLNEKYYDTNKEEMYLIRVLRTMQENMNHPNSFHETTYTQAAFSLGSLYSREYMKKQNRTYLLRAAYCYVLAYETGNQYGLTNLRELPYNPTETEWKKWRNDAQRFVYYPPC